MAKATKKKETANAWEDVPAVVAKPVTVEPVEAQTVRPFGSMSNIQKAIREFREEVAKTPFPRNGKAATNQGAEYNYCLSEEVFQIATKFCESKQLFLDTNSYIAPTGGTIVTMCIYDYTPAEGSAIKEVSIAVGTPQALGDLGARITYAQKYLVALLFGVSVQTDGDAFNNSIIKQHNESRQHEPVADTTVPDSSSNSGGDDVKPVSVDAGVSVPPSNDTNSGTSNHPGSEKLEHTKSYPLAKEFIVKSLSQAMLDSAVTKVTNSVSMRDDEKTELLALIETRRNEVTG